MQNKPKYALLLLVTLALLIAAVGSTTAQDDIIGPDEYPEGVNPLTGLAVSDPTTIARRPVAVKISNYPPDPVRPQSGLSQADIVFEHEAEGGTTRMTAIFLSTFPDKVGSMRSARLIDTQLPAMYRAIFIFSGASDGVRQRLYSMPFGEQGRAMLADTLNEPVVFRDADIPAPHNFFANTQEVSALADLWGIRNDTPGLHGTAFSASIPAGGTPARVIDLSYGNEEVRWFYEGRLARYARYSDGEPHMDRVNGQQLTAQNVVVLYVDHVEDTSIREDEFGGGHYSIEIQLWGQGPCELFRDGQRFSCLWARADDFSMLTLTTPDGTLLPLKPGVTWYQIMRPGSSVDVH